MQNSNVCLHILITKFWITKHCLHQSMVCWKLIVKPTVEKQLPSYKVYKQFTNPTSSLLFWNRQQCHSVTWVYSFYITPCCQILENTSLNVFKYHTKNLFHQTLSSILTQPTSQLHGTIEIQWILFLLLSGLADLNQGDLNHWFKSRFKSNDFLAKKSLDLNHTSLFHYVTIKCTFWKFLLLFLTNIYSFIH